MEKKKKIKTDTLKRYAAPGIITLFIMLFILASKRIWPFGINRIDFFDNMQQVAPLYCHLWDWMHGKASLWFDWYTGLGTNVSMSISAFSMLSPFNIILYFVPRNLILEFISVLTVIKTVVMSVTMYALIERRYKKLSYSMKVMFSIMYAFCGYVLIFGSCFTPWMDVVALFPLLMISLDHLMKTGKKLFYILMVGLIFIINYYLGAMSLVYIFFAAGIRMATREDKSEWGRKAWNIGIGTVAGVGLSAFVLFPVFCQLSTSQRSTGSKAGLLSQYFGWISAKTFVGSNLAMLQRFIMLFGMAFAIVVIIAGMRVARKTKEDLGYTIGMLALVLTPVIAEGTNLMWHFGSYNGYTLRMGYVIAFTLICLACEAGEKVFETGSISSKCGYTQLIGVCVACSAVIIGYRLIPEGTTEAVAKWFFLIVFLLFVCVYLALFVLNKWKVNPATIIGLVVIELFIGAFALIGPPKFYEFEAYQYGDYVQLTNDAMESLEIEESATDRITNPDISLNANYPLIMRRGAQSSFTAALLADTQNSSVEFGYSRYFLWLLDSGGTVFSNALLHVTEAVNQNPLDKSLYTLKATGGTLAEYNLYDANYTLPFAMYVDSDLYNTNVIGDGDWIDLQNAFYSSMASWMGYTGDLADDLITRYDGANEDEYGIVSYGQTIYRFEVSGRQALYMSATTLEEFIAESGEDIGICGSYSQASIKVNGRFITIPTLGDVKNTRYSTFYNNNLVYLGTFEDEKVTIQIIYREPMTMDDGSKKPNFVERNNVVFGGVDIDKLGKLCASYNAAEKCDVTYDNDSVSVTISGATKDSTVLLPVIYNSDNWTVTIDGRKADAKNVEGLFTAVNVKSGTHTIKMEFSPKGKDIGFLISISILALTFVLVIIGRFVKIKTPVFCENAAKYIYGVLFVGGCVLMFIIPLFSSFVVDFLQIFGIIK